MFNDRDLGILGGGALLAVLCLFLPLPFVGKMVIGFLVLVGFMALALLRLGPDRVPPEVWLARRFRYANQTRKYVNQQEPTTRKTQQESVPANQPRQAPEPGKAKSAPAASVATTVPNLRPLDLAWNEIGVYPLLTALLGVVGVYFVVWLYQGGAAELALWFQ
jgi:hypothetical protein